ncbi:hypothetical protein DFH08DRAFT_1001780 [Mycena albidolilacea]|uniref:Uncharacterized protein n=1 Tax=Mycena albidolilacea TaxID=1033008 RepID=A0AAD7A2H0_9AGAR|nr:hypothetical protein DFH08DRAFT_1001780 [Mycena albidolilacea]
MVTNLWRSREIHNAHASGDVGTKPLRRGGGGQHQLEDQRGARHTCYKFGCRLESVSDRQLRSTITTPRGLLGTTRLTGRKACAEPSAEMVDSGNDRWTIHNAKHAAPTPVFSYIHQFRPKWSEKERFEPLPNRRTERVEPPRLQYSIESIGSGFAPVHRARRPLSSLLFLTGKTDGVLLVAGSSSVVQTVRNSNSFRIQMGGGVMGKYARASLLILLSLLLIASLNIFFELKKKLMELSEWTQGVEPYVLLQWQRRTKLLQLYTVYRVRLSVSISPKSKL